MRNTWEKVTAVVLAFVLILSSGTIVFAADLPEVEHQELEQELEPQNIQSCDVDEIEAVEFNGKRHKPKVVVYNGETRLAAGKDYLVVYGENIQAGKGYVELVGLGNYTGTLKKTFVIKPAKVSIKGVHVAATGKPKLSWTKVKGAAEYKVYSSKKKNGPYQVLTTTTKMSHVHAKAERSQTYFYQVKAVDQSGKMKSFQVSNVVKLTCKLPAPKVKSSNILKTGKPKLTWTKIKGAEKYKVYRAVKKNGTYEFMITTKNTSWIHEKAIAGTKYYYKVKAVDMDNQNASSALSTYHVRSSDLQRPVVKVTLNNKAKPKLTWKKVAGAERYEIFRAVKKNGTYQSIGKTKNASYVDTKAKGGKVYHYRVRALDADNRGANSAKSLKVSIYAVDLNKKLVALTFDDGPGPYTETIVNTLRKNNAKATFYVLGSRVSSYPEALKAIHQGGNEIGNHSYSHPILSYEGSSVIKSQMNRTDKAVKKLTGVVPKTMRPPGGGINSTVKSTVGKPLIMWNVDTRDWEHRDTHTTINCVMNEASDGDIILMHDIHEPTMEAAVQLIPKLKKKGFELVTVSELAKFKGKTLKKGTVYYSL